MQTQVAPGGSSAPPTPRPAAWGVYFPDSSYTPQDRRAQLVQELLDAFSTEAGWRLLNGSLQPMPQLSACVVVLDYHLLLQICDSANLAAALEMQPAEGLLCLQAAVHEVRSPSLCSLAVLPTVYLLRRSKQDSPA